MNILYNLTYIYRYIIIHIKIMILNEMKQIKQTKKHNIPIYYNKNYIIKFKP